MAASEAYAAFDMPEPLPAPRFAELTAAPPDDFWTQERQAPAAPVPGTYGQNAAGMPDFGMDSERNSRYDLRQDTGQDSDTDIPAVLRRSSFQN